MTVSDSEAPVPGDPADVEASKTQRPKRASRPASKGGSRPGPVVSVKVGGHTIAMPSSMAAHMTPKDEKRLVAIFKRILKRQKKNAPKKRAAVKR